MLFPLSKADVFRLQGETADPGAAGHWVGTSKDRGPGGRHVATWHVAMVGEGIGMARYG